MTKKTFLLEVDSEHDAGAQIRQCLDEEIRTEYVRAYQLRATGYTNKLPDAKELMKQAKEHFPEGMKGADAEALHGYYTDLYSAEVIDYDITLDETGADSFLCAQRWGNVPVFTRDGRDRENKFVGVIFDTNLDIPKTRRMLVQQTLSLWNDSRKFDHLFEAAGPF